MFDKKETHPAQGVVVLTKRHGNGQTIFGSDNLHSETVCLQFKEASVTRNLARNWIFGEKTILELRMSAAQWGEMISSFSNGSGTPVTYTHRADIGKAVPEYEIPQTDREKYTAEMREHIDIGLKAIRDLKEKIIASLNKPNVTKKEMKEMIYDIEKAERELVPNTKFIVDSFEKSTQKRLSDARIEIEAAAHNYIVELGLNTARLPMQVDNKDILQ